MCRKTNAFDGTAEGQRTKEHQVAKEEVRKKMKY